MKRNDISLFSSRAIILTLCGALFLKILLICLFMDMVYPDVRTALNFGEKILTNKGMFGKGDVINSKTFIGPILWFSVYKIAGVMGLKIVNVLCFVFLFITQYFIGRKFYSYNTLVTASYLFAFYVGTNLNVVAGEQDDLVAPLFFTIGILLYLDKKNIVLCGVLMGVGFLFKFSAAIFCLGFEIYLLMNRRWKRFLLAGVGMILPFLCFNLIDGFNTLNALVLSIEIQKDYSPWGQIVFKLFSTGMLFAFLASLWTLLKEKKDHTSLFFVLFAVYLAYVLVMRDAFAASYVMMQCLIFASFLIAEFLLKNESLIQVISRKAVVYGTLIFYFLITTWITVHNLFCDTLELK